MVFSTFYTKVKNFFMKKFCPGRYKQKKDIGMLENPIEFEDEKKPDNTFRDEDSSRHGLAMNESNRQGDSPSRHPKVGKSSMSTKGKVEGKIVKDSNDSSTIILPKVKGVETKGKSKKKVKEPISSSSALESSDESNEKKNNKFKRKQTKIIKDDKKTKGEKKKDKKDSDEKGTIGSGESSSLNALGETKSD
jgi:hypothetical protein